MHKQSPGAAKPLQVVTQIDVTYENGAIRTVRHYKDAGKMKQVLNYLRLIDPYGTPALDPEYIKGSDFRIELTYSDGSSKVYRQKADRYMQIDDGPWRSINPARAEELSLLLGQMESDGE
ncbi:MAG: hypothetical protein E7439_00605 [Ruminococcaceae bacterium]|nr:hypothetical protein [Oscillospiraceae bacterium]